MKFFEVSSTAAFVIPDVPVSTDLSLPEPEFSVASYADKNSQRNREYKNPAAEESKKYAVDTPIYVLDLETDPFLRDRVPLPFCGGLYDGKTFSYCWGDDCIDRIYEKLTELPPGIVYLHNGGKFDLFFFLKYLEGKMLVINGRIVKATGQNKHEFRDSYAIMPIPLSEYKKDDIDYKKLEADVRELHKSEILKYLESDCFYLFELVSNFIARFGIQITIGATSMKQFRAIHKYERMNAREDYDIRGGVKYGEAKQGFYYGGRVQVIRRGIITGDLKVYDVNSMYPFAMRNYLHPIGCVSDVSTVVKENTCFIEVEGQNYGAFPLRTKTGLDFTRDRGRYTVTIHEWETALRHGLFVPDRIIRCLNFSRRSTFAEFVDKFYNLRKQAKDNGDTFGSLFYKLVLNSSYGKLAANPEDYQDFQILKLVDGNVTIPEGWSTEKIVWGEFGIFSRPSEKDPSYFNVAAGASITGAARAILMDAIHRAKNPIYCDTDSIICESLEGVSLDDKELGAWKLEAEGSMIAVAGKKTYAVFDQDRERIKRRLEQCRPNDLPELMDRIQPNGDLLLKQANKGVVISAQDIIRVCNGDEVKCYKDAPTFSIGREPRFQSRTVKMTGMDLMDAL